MAAYATALDMVARYGEADLIRLTDRAGTLGGIDADVLTTALDDATAEINGWLAKRYADRLPFADPPRVLTAHACTIAWYRLQGAQADQGSERMHEAALRFLRAVARGEASLGDEDPGASQVSSPGPVIEEGPGRVMGRDSLKGF